MPMKRRPALRAATSVEPEPQNGSSTAPPGAWGMGMGSGITIISIYPRLTLCRADQRDNIMLIFA